MSDTMGKPPASSTTWERRILRPVLATLSAVALLMGIGAVGAAPASAVVFQSAGFITQSTFCEVPASASGRGYDYRARVDIRFETSDNFVNGYRMVRLDDYRVHADRKSPGTSTWSTSADDMDWVQLKVVLRAVGTSAAPSTTFLTNTSPADNVWYEPNGTTSSHSSTYPSSGATFVSGRNYIEVTFHGENVRGLVGCITDSWPYANGGDIEVQTYPY